MRRLFLTSAAAIGLLGLATTANAAPLSTTFTYSLWNTTSAGGQPTSPDNQALPTNPLALGTPTASGTFTGALNLFGTNGKIGDFLNSSGATVTGLGSAASLTDSASGFKISTLYKFEFTTLVGLTGTVSHDDGVSIALTNGTVLVDSSAPTAEIPTTYTIAPGTYDIWYVEANGLPAVLDFEATPVPSPEPISMALLGTGLVGLGALRRRSR